MSVFRFKHFEVRNERSAMKVNTDGVLLGTAMTVLPDDRRLLDVGTGTGTVALIAAQRLFSQDSSSKSIIGIDIDPDSAVEAAANFSASPWAGALRAENIALDEFEGEGPFDFIFSNPPYFESSLKAPDQRRRAARHAETLSYRDLIAFSARHLTPEGRLSMILPAENERETVRYAASFGLKLFRVLRVRTVPRRPVSRVVIEFCREDADFPISRRETLPNQISRRETSPDPISRRGEPPVEEEMVIRDGEGYSKDYLALTEDFLLLKK